MRNRLPHAALLLVALALHACSGGGSDAERTPPGGDSAPTTDPNPVAAANPGSLTQDAIARRVFHTGVRELVLHAFHEDGAEPYTGRLGLSFDDTWDISEQSLGALFENHPARSLRVPSTLQAMTAVADQGVQDWSLEALVALGDALRPPLASADGSVVNVSIVFLNGLYEGNAGVLGIHPSNRPFAFVFKDVVRRVGGDAMTQRYVEQATVVHELGHTIGFVDNGVPMVNAHQDIEHPHHTTDEDGVMFWQVESPEGSLALATSLITGATLQLFGPATLLDAHNHQPSD